MNEPGDAVAHASGQYAVPGGPHVVAIGGGHGLAMLLRAVRTYAGRTTAVVSTADDGGSSGRLREHLGMPAPGDLRRCLTSVGADQELARVFEHRFTTGDLAGHAVGNLVLAGLVDAGHGLDVAADLLAHWLGVDGQTMQVLPATVAPIDLVAETPAGTVRGQVEIEEAGELKRVAVDPPEPPVSHAVFDAIEEADQVVLGPGSFYTSVLAPAVVPGIRRSLEARTGRFVFVCNLRAAETNVEGFDVARHLAVLHDHGLRPDAVVTQSGALAVGDVDRSVEVIEADIDRPHGLAHDPDLLGEVLAGIR